MITVYTAPRCHYCDKLKKFLDEQGIQYETKELNKDISPSEYADRFNVMSVPLTVIGEGNNQKTVVGFEPDKIKQLLENIGLN